MLPKSANVVYCSKTLLLLTLFKIMTARIPSAEGLPVSLQGQKSRLQRGFGKFEPFLSNFEQFPALFSAEMPPNLRNILRVPPTATLLLFKTLIVVLLFMLTIRTLFRS